MSLIVDANCMVGKSATPRPDWPVRPAETADALRRVGIRRALVCNFVSLHYDPVQGAEYLAADLADQPDFFSGCPAAVPHWAGDAPGAKGLLDAYIQRDWRAFRLYPKLHNFLFHRMLIGPLLEEAQDRRFTVLINRDQFEWTELIDVLRSFPRLKLIVCNEGYRATRTLFALFEQFPEVRFETSWLEQFLLCEAVVRQFGAGRLVFGTQFPRFEPGATLAPILRADIPEDAREQILGRNLTEMLAEAR